MNLWSRLTDLSWFYFHLDLNAFAWCSHIRNGGSSLRHLDAFLRKPQVVSLASQGWLIASQESWQSSAGITIHHLVENTRCIFWHVSQASTGAWWYCGWLKRHSFPHLTTLLPAFHPAAHHLSKSRVTLQAEGLEARSKKARASSLLLTNRFINRRYPGVLRSASGLHTPAGLSSLYRSFA